MHVQISWKEIYDRVSKLDKTKKYYGIPRGGSVISALTGNAVETPEQADIIIDDIYDSGKTAQEHEKYNKEMVFIFDKRKEFKNTWLQLPYEEPLDKDMEHHVVRLLEALGHDVNREGLQETPKRYVKFLRDFCKKEEFNFTTFNKESYDEMIVENNLEFYSLCEHHLLPFFGNSTIAYIPNDKIVGLSKLPRVLDNFSKNLQNQERITTQIAEFLMEKLEPKGVGVILRGTHLCMSMRGVRKPNAITITSCLKGVFKTNESCREEFLKLSNGNH